MLLPFTVFLVPFFGVTNSMTSTAAAMFLPTAVSVVVADCRGWKLDSQLAKTLVILRCVGEQCSPLRLRQCAGSFYNGAPSRTSGQPLLRRCRNSTLPPPTVKHHVLLQIYEN